MGVPFGDDPVWALRFVPADGRAAAPLGWAPAIAAAVRVAAAHAAWLASEGERGVVEVVDAAWPWRDGAVVHRVAV